MAQSDAIKRIESLLKSYRRGDVSFAKRYRLAIEDAQRGGLFGEADIELLQRAPALIESWSADPQSSAERPFDQWLGMYDDSQGEARNAIVRALLNHASANVDL